MAAKHRLFVGGLFPGVTEDVLVEKLSKFGVVSDVEIKTRTSDDGEPIKTFAHLNIEAPESNVKRLMSTLSKTKWKGSELHIQKAKEDVLKRLERKRQQAAEAETARANAGPKSPLDSVQGISNFELKGAKPGTPVPGVKSWVVGKYGRVVPIVKIKKAGKNKPVTIDPSKYCHNLKVFKNDDDDDVANTSLSQLIWEPEEDARPSKRESLLSDKGGSVTKRKGQLALEESEAKKKKTQSLTPKTSSVPSSAGRNYAVEDFRNDDDSFEVVSKKTPVPQKEMAKKTGLTPPKQKMERRVENGYDSSSSADTDEIASSASRALLDQRQLGPHKPESKEKQRGNNSCVAEEKGGNRVNSKTLNGKSTFAKKLEVAEDSSCGIPPFRGTSMLSSDDEGGDSDDGRKEQRNAHSSRPKQQQKQQANGASAALHSCKTGITSSDKESDDDDGVKQEPSIHHKTPRQRQKQPANSTPAIPPFCGTSMMSDSDEDDTFRKTSQHASMLTATLPSVISGKTKMKSGMSTKADESGGSDSDDEDDEDEEEEEEEGDVDLQNNEISVDDSFSDDDDDDEEEEDDNEGEEEQEDSDDDDDDDDDDDEEEEEEEEDSDSDDEEDEDNEDGVHVSEDEDDVSKKVSTETTTNKMLSKVKKGDKPDLRSTQLPQYHSSDSEESYMKMPKSSSTPELSAATDTSKQEGMQNGKWSLFDSSSSDDEDDAENFRKPQFEGAKGEKLMKMQKAVGKDPRFQMDESFLSSSDEDKDEAKKEDSSEDVRGEEDLESLSLAEEKARNLRLLEKVVGKEKLAQLDRKLERQRKQREFLLTSYNRYDPTLESEEETSAKPAQEKVQKKQKEKKRKAEVREEEEEEVSRKKIKSKAVRDSSSDSESDQAEEPETVTVKAATTSADEAVDIGEYFRKETSKSDTTKKPFSLMEVLGEGSSGSDSEEPAMSAGQVHDMEKDSSSEEEEEEGEEEDEEEDESEKEKEEAKHIDHVPGKEKPRTFFVHSLDDPRLQPKGIFDIKEGGPPQEYLDWWYQTRPERVAAYKKRHKEAKRKQKKTKEQPSWKTKSAKRRF